MDPYTAHGSVIEAERRPDGRVEQALTLFASGAECPFTCSFCDLWRYTVEGPTPRGALAGQVQGVLESLDSVQPERFKFYNASNFFDVRAVPAEDASRIAALTRNFSAVTVESHASTIGPRVVDFARQIGGRLEVAVGLETIHAVAMQHLNKRLDLDRFDSAARFLSEHDIDLRVFVLLGVPYVPADEMVAWTARAVAYAVERGASVVSVIPVRGGNGELERLRDLGHFVPPTLFDLENVIDACGDISSAVVSADLWDVSLLSACTECREQRVQRLERWNLTGAVESRIHCRACEAA